MRPFRLVLAIVTLLSYVIPSTLSAGERSNIRGMGMARTFVVSSRGLDAVGINPANFAVYDSSTSSFSIVPFGVHVGSDVLDYEMYTKYFTGVRTDSGRVGRYLTESDKSVIINGFANDVGRTGADIEARLVGITYSIDGLGGGAFTITDRVGGFADVPRDYLEFILNGNSLGSTYHFDNTKVQASWIREYALSVGGKLRVSFLKSLSAGGAAKLIHGFGYYEIQRFNTSLVTDEQATLTGSVDFLSRAAGADPTSVRHIGSYKMFPDVAGKGLGIDLGIRAVVEEYLALGLSVTDIGSIKWNRNVRGKIADTTITVDDPLNEAQRTTIENVVKGRPRSIDRFSTSLPTTLRVGVALDVNRLPGMEDMSEPLLIELDYNQSLVETPFSTTIPRVSLGVEYMPLSWLPLRSGISLGGSDRINLALGVGISFAAFEFELASENVTWLFAPNSFSQGSIAIGSRLRF